jgi:cytoskeleton protein RodZ
MMRRARRAAGVELSHLAQRTRIPLSSIKALEADRVDTLPGRAYARGFYMTVARQLREDPGPWLAAFDREHPEDEPLTGSVAAVSWYNRPLAGGHIDIPVRLGHVLAVLLGILTFFLLYFALEGGSAAGGTTASSQEGSLIEMLDKRPVQRR